MGGLYLVCKDQKLRKVMRLMHHRMGFQGAVHLFHSFKGMGLAAPQNKKPHWHDEAHVKHDMLMGLPHAL